LRGHGQGGQHSQENRERCQHKRRGCISHRREVNPFLSFCPEI
jgi:hypothetical protein